MYVNLLTWHSYNGTMQYWRLKQKINHKILQYNLILLTSFLKAPHSKCRITKCNPNFWLIVARLAVEISPTEPPPCLGSTIANMYKLTGVSHVA